MSESFNIGEKVRLMDQPGEFIVIKISVGSQICIEDEHGFEYQTTVENIVKIEAKKYEKIEASSFEVNQKEKEARKKTQKKVQKHVPIIDLHIENLVNSHRHMTNHEIVLYQLNHLTNKLNNLLRNQVREIIIVHGIGTGKLKTEVQHLLHTKYPQLEYMDDHITPYGVGATRVFR